MGLLSLLLKPLENIIRGKEGERAVKRKLNPLFDSDYHYTINDYYIIDENNKTHQIDHIEIRTNGIFCIETKNYAGKLYGNANSQTWIQYLGRTSNTVTNPLKQNYSHIYHLNNLLDNKYFINSVVVLCQGNAKSLNIENVVNLRDIRKYCRTFYCKKEYSKEEVDEIYNKLISLKVKVSNREHIKNIKETKKNLSRNICPRCGGNLVLKVGKYGSFFGCENFPKCRFIKK